MTAVCSAVQKPGPNALQNEAFGNSPGGKALSPVPAQRCMKWTFDNVFLFGFHGTVLVVRGLKGCLPWEAAEASPCLTDPILASSRMDPLLAKAKPFSDCGSSWPQPPFPVLHHWEEEGRKIRSEVKPRKKGGMGSRRCPGSNGNKFNSFPQVKFCPWW